MTVAPENRIGLLSAVIRQEQDIVQARQRARQIASLLQFPRQDQARIATAVSEMARNAYQYAHGGRVEFSLDLSATPRMLWILISDTGPGIADLDTLLAGSYQSSTGMGLGVVGSRRLMDEFRLTSEPGKGTRAWLGKAIPAVSGIDSNGIAQLCLILSQDRTTGPHQEIEQQSKELILALDALRNREVEVERRKQELARLSLELEETNRGVVALYAELDDKAAALRQADQMRARFLSHVSHEFRTPVNSVLALTHLLLQRVDGDLTSEQEKQVSYIRDAAQQLADMVNDLLDLAKVDAGKTEVRITEINVAQFLRAIRALMRPLAAQENVALLFEEPEFDLFIDTDEGKLAQIIRNLISNALKFTPQGEVRVNAQLSGGGSTVQFSVKDSGIGIAKEHQEQIFQEFAQIDSPLQRRVKGTGLGLPLSRRLANLLGGSLTVSSEVGLGSTFTLTLPARVPGTERAASFNKDTAPVREQRSVLVVDDDSTARYLVRQLFRGSRYEVIESEGGDAAERARFDRPALIVLDLVMPDRTGFDVLNELKSHESTKDMPVVIHTSKALKEEDYASLGGRQLAVLPKGVSERLPALLAMRSVLGDDSLFAGEPEFKSEPKL